MDEVQEYFANITAIVHIQKYDCKYNLSLAVRLNAATITLADRKPSVLCQIIAKIC